MESSPCVKIDITTPLSCDSFIHGHNNNNVGTLSPSSVLVNEDHHVECFSDDDDLINDPSVQYSNNNEKPSTINDSDTDDTSPTDSISGDVPNATGSIDVIDTAEKKELVRNTSSPFADSSDDEGSNVIVNDTDNECVSCTDSGKIINMDRDYTGMFEGPEKTLEVVFRRMNSDNGMNDPSDPGVVSTTTIPTNSSSNSGNNQLGLRQLCRTDIDRICDRARCTILSSISNQYLDAYVLSESSLFIYPYMLVLKTCGTTTLLRCIATLIDLGRKLGLEIDWVGYSRKNFNFPGDQAFPHQSFHQELDYLYSHRVLSERLDGNGYTLGPVNGDHWFVFVADHTSRTGALEIDTDRVLNIMMFDIDENVAKFFYYDEYDRNIDGESKEEEVLRISNEQTIESGIKDLCPGAIIDPRAFEPCGYSMNAVLFRSYSTIHITPESGSSYASFETNQKVGSYKALISNVIRTFRPKRFVMTLMADEGGLKQVKDNPLADAAIDSKIVVPPTKIPTDCSATSALRLASYNVKQSFTYKRSSLASIKVEEDCCCMMGNWVLEKTNPATSSTSTSQLFALDNPRLTKQRGMTMS